jgi:hypothetical protein
LPERPRYCNDLAAQRNAEPCAPSSGGRARCPPQQTRAIPLQPAGVAREIPRPIVGANGADRSDMPT